MLIGEVARLSGVGVQTVRYYEREGLLPTARRTGSGYRQFTSEAPRIIRFVKTAQTLGFSLDEIRDLVRLRAQPARRREDVRTIARSRLGTIEDKIAKLERMRSALAELICACEHAADSLACPILESFDGAEQGAAS